MTKTDKLWYAAIGCGLAGVFIAHFVRSDAALGAVAAMATMFAGLVLAMLSGNAIGK